MICNFPLPFRKLNNKNFKTMYPKQNIVNLIAISFYLSCCTVQRIYVSFTKNIAQNIKMYSLNVEFMYALLN